MIAARASGLLAGRWRIGIEAESDQRTGRRGVMVVLRFVSLVLLWDIAWKRFQRRV
jgi:hypothetical protein